MTTAKSKVAAKNAASKAAASKAAAGKAAAGKTKVEPPLKSWAGRVPTIRPGRYSDGLPYDQVTYLCCKMMLRPNHFTSRRSLFEFARVMKDPADETGTKLSTAGYGNEPIQIREVLFVDTPDFRLYNNAFILRRRIAYEDGFPVGDPEIVFKFRHADIQKAAETDVRPQILGDHRVKFKIQALPLKERLGGIRLLYSHNVQFPRSNMGRVDILSMDSWMKVFPALEVVKRVPNEKVALVSDTIIEEVLQDIAMLDFGDGIKAKTNVSIWRTRGEHRPLIGEFAFQVKFRDRKEMTLEAMQRAEKFFIALQFAAKDWISLTATKTGAVYRLQGNPPKSNE